MTSFLFPHIEVYQTDPERRLVTGIELLSPSNKRRGTKGWRLYHRKRQVFLRGLAHFVELDLLRRGRRMPMAGRWPDSPYYLLVRRKQEAPRCTVWPAHFRRSLPPLSIPLAAPDPDITLVLQPLVDAVDARSHYDRDVDYRRPLHPPLCPSDTTWLKERLRNGATRPAAPLMQQILLLNVVVVLIFFLIVIFRSILSIFRDR